MLQGKRSPEKRRLSRVVLLHGDPSFLMHRYMSTDTKRGGQFVGLQECECSLETKRHTRVV
jgi:hypothetical protein